MSLQARNIAFGSAAYGDLSADATSDTIDLSYQAANAIQCRWNGGTGIEGMLDLQMSVDGVYWTVNANTTARISSGGQESLIWDLPPSAIPFVRVRYRRTAGSGSLYVTAHGKRQ